MIFRHFLNGSEITSNHLFYFGVLYHDNISCFNLKKAFGEDGFHSAK